MCVKQRLWGLALLALWLLVGCSPTPTLVEVTRVAAVDNTVSTPTIVEVEVTRLVTETETVVVEEAIVPDRPQPGSAERPFLLLFAPVVDTAVMNQRAQIFANWLIQQTGQQFQVGIANDEQSVIDLMCAAPQETIGFLTALGVAAANQQCGVQAVATAVQGNGLSWNAGMIVVRNDSDIETLADLADKRWAVPDEDSLSNTLYFQALLAAQGIELAEIVVVPGDNTAMLAVYNGEVDFATGTYLPPLLPFNEREWNFGEDDPELWREANVFPTRSSIGFVVVNGRPENGGYRVRDARSGVFDTVHGIFDETQILTLSAPIPADSVALGGEFPFGLAQQMETLLTEFAESEQCVESFCALDFYGWTGMETAVATSYEPLHFIIETLGRADEGLLTE